MVSRQTEERRALNESRFREANANIAETASRLLLESKESIPFLCECSDARCTEIVPLSGEQYAEVRSSPRWFLHHPGHDPNTDETEKLVEDRGGYLIMEKLGHAGEVAESEAKV